MLVAAVPKLMVVTVDTSVETPTQYQVAPQSTGAKVKIVDNTVIETVTAHLFAPFAGYSNVAKRVAIVVTNPSNATTKMTTDDDVKAEAMKAISSEFAVTVNVHLENTVELVYLVAIEY